MSAVHLTQAVTSKDRRDSRRLLNASLESNVESTRTRAEVLLHRKCNVPGFGMATWVVTYDEALQLVHDVLPRKFTGKNVDENIRIVFQSAATHTNIGALPVQTGLASSPHAQQQQMQKTAVVAPMPPSSITADCDSIEDIW